MAIKTREEILSSIRERFGEDTSDATLSLVEDITDTLTDLEAKNNANNNENWKKKYEDNDAAWRKKYRDRFFSDGEDDEDDIEPPAKKNNYSYDNLFKEG